jgi:hypothetical protein
VCVFIGKGPFLGGQDLSHFRIFPITWNGREIYLLFYVHSLSLSAKNISLVTEILRGAPLAETYGRVLSKLSIL